MSRVPASGIAGTKLLLGYMDQTACTSVDRVMKSMKHSLFREIFVIYRSTSKAAKQAIHRQIPILVRTLGSSSHLLEIISDPPNGSENLLMQ
ncbi:symplekin-like, partial [Trifolium medium]|nr:symplekin-like [Trifolium medium]